MIWRKTKSAWRALGLGQLKSRAAAYAALRERMPPCGSACRGTGAVFVPAAPEFCRVGTEFVKSVPLSMRFGRLGNRFLANLFPDRPLSGGGGTEKRKSVPQSRYAGRLRDRSCPRPTGQTSFGTETGEAVPKLPVFRRAGTGKLARRYGERKKLVPPAGEFADLWTAQQSPSTSAVPAASAPRSPDPRPPLRGLAAPLLPKPGLRFA